MSQIQQQDSFERLETGVRDQAVNVLHMLGASVWGLSLAVIGLWVLAEPMLPGMLGRFTALERVLVGIGMMAGGQLIFLMFVAERLFPRVPQRLSAWAQWGMFVMGVVCFIAFVAVQFYPGSES